MKRFCYIIRCAQKHSRVDRRRWPVIITLCTRAHGGFFSPSTSFFCAHSVEIARRAWQQQCVSDTHTVVLYWYFVSVRASHTCQ